MAWTSGRKLAIASAVIAGVVGYMAFVGASGGWQYYMTADECLANTARAAGHRVRVSGRIAADSLQVAADRRQASFVLAGTTGNLPVVCTGLLPEPLTGSMEVVVEGRLESPCLLRGDKILTRCASKYESK
ncbi:MAG: cytochrome c maturation protein CcmE [Thermoguttaceae bacterium]|jgi:cytochrome c-type biogenesis protein CcmE